MNVSKLIHKATLSVPTFTKTARGDTTVTYADDGELYCAIDPLSGRELFWAKQLRADLSHKIVMRYTARVTHKCRLRWNGKYFELGPPLPKDERNEEMAFTAIEIFNAAPTTTTTPAP